MASTYKTPNVFIKEIPKLPSVAQVETAIPAFIGYTEISEVHGKSLINKAKSVSSLTEYEIFFGKGPESSYQIYLDANNNIYEIVSSLPYCMYECIRLFYNNGGGKCYIISVGKYKNSGTLVDPTELNQALEILENEDEPTIIVCPDATLLDNEGLYDFQKLALAQCAKLQNRILLCDTLPSNEYEANKKFNDRIQEFRDKIGINNLKYGAAYAPYINSTLTKTIKYRNIALRRGTPSSFTNALLKSLSSDNDIIQLISDLEGAKKAVDDLNAIISSDSPRIFNAPNKSFEEQYKSLFEKYSEGANDIEKTDAVKALYAFTLKILAAVKNFQDTLPEKVFKTPVPASTDESVSFILKDEITSLALTSKAKTIFETLIKHSNAFGEGTQADELMPDDPDDPGNDLSKALTILGISTSPTDYDVQTTADIDVLYKNPVSDAQKNEEALTAIAASYPVIVKFYHAIQKAAASYEQTLDDRLEAEMGIYKQIKDKISFVAIPLPPGAAVAGIYTRVDNTRGVWNAPANESINSVSGPVIQITPEEQSFLNVDTIAGKSINAIRTFIGKGTLVWGARTLAGNVDEWRYISVRRFFIMVEESSKKAVKLFLFENNNANTWNKIQSMLENFLVDLWKQGALQGVKPEQAFYVSIGLGKTMTELDILEGRLIVEIGMAVLKPAEFIILRFSQKMVDSKQHSCVKPPTTNNIQQTKN